MATPGDSPPQKWHYLGHAMWLVVIGELRLLFDPLLDDLHHGDVFVVWPPRRILAEALRPDFIIVTHRHPDHFDVSSLFRLAELDRDSVVVTACPLVEQTAKRIGFSTVARVDELHHIALDGAELITTPSYTDVVEWGMVVASRHGVAWNQVDTICRDRDDVALTLRRVGEGLGRQPLSLDLAIVRWQPLLEVASVLGHATTFPRSAYAELLELAAAVPATHYVPGAAGGRHHPRHDWLNRHVYPASHERFVADLQRRLPAASVTSPALGDMLCVADGVHVEPADEQLVEPISHAPEAPFLPTSIPPLEDVGEVDSALLRAWLDDDLVVALRHAWPRMGAARRQVLALEVVLADDRWQRTYLVDAAGVEVRDGIDPEYDVYNAIAASALCDVVGGRRHWGEPLLAGQIRVVERSYDVDERGLHRTRVAPIFLYYAIGYDESQERAIDHLLTQLGR